VISVNVVDIVPAEKIWFRTGEVAKILGVNVATIRRWIKENKLKAYRIGERYRVHRDDLIEFLKVHNLDEDIINEALEEEDGKN
jgi:putative resolvase